MHILSVALEPFVVVGAGKGDVSSVRVAGEQNTRFFEQLARGCHVIRDRVGRRQAAELPGRVIDSVTPVDAAVMIRRIHSSAWKHMGTAHERRSFVTPHQEHLRSSRTVAQHDHRGGGTRIGNEGIRGHDGQY